VVLVKYNNNYKVVIINNIMDFGEYLDAMRRTYDEIEHSGRDLYVARYGTSSDGESILFALPAAKSDGEDREIRDDGTVVLTDRDKLHVNRVLGSQGLRSLGEGTIRVYRFESPYDPYSKDGKRGDGRKEAVALGVLEEVVKGGGANIFDSSGLED